MNQTVYNGNKEITFNKPVIFVMNLNRSLPEKNSLLIYQVSFFLPRNSSINFSFIHPGPVDEFLSDDWVQLSGEKKMHLLNRLEVFVLDEHFRDDETMIIFLVICLYFIFQ